MRFCLLHGVAWGWLKCQKVRSCLWSSFFYLLAGVCNNDKQTHYLLLVLLFPSLFLSTCSPVQHQLIACGKITCMTGKHTQQKITSSLANQQGTWTRSRKRKQTGIRKPVAQYYSLQLQLRLSLFLQVNLLQFPMGRAEITSERDVFGLRRRRTDTNTWRNGTSHGQQLHTMCLLFWCLCCKISHKVLGNDLSCKCRGMERHDLDWKQLFVHLMNHR